MKIKQYFSTPFFHGNVQKNTFCDELYDFILSSVNEENRMINPPQGSHPDLFESKFDFLNWNVPLTNQLKQMLFQHVFEFIRQMNDIPPVQLQKMKCTHESWFHVAKNGGFFQNHTHPNHSLSVVFCVNPGTFNPDNNYEQGKLLFTDPRINASMFIDSANRSMKREYSFSGFRIRPEKGSIIIFPSYLQHAVDPYVGEEYRVTVAANFKFHFEG